jgi:hypothetical protein
MLEGQEGRAERKALMNLEHGRAQDNAVIYLLDAIFYGTGGSRRGKLILNGERNDATKNITDNYPTLLIGGIGTLVFISNICVSICSGQMSFVGHYLSTSYTEREFSSGND